MTSCLLGRKGDNSFRPLAVWVIGRYPKYFEFLTEESGRRGVYRTDGTGILGILEPAERFDDIEILSEAQPPIELLWREAESQQRLVQAWYDEQLAAGAI
jgi:hypothetical protein